MPNIDLSPSTPSIQIAYIVKRRLQASYPPKRAGRGVDGDTFLSPSISPSTGFTPRPKCLSCRYQGVIEHRLSTLYQEERSLPTDRRKLSRAERVMDRLVATGLAEDLVLWVLIRWIREHDEFFRLADRAPVSSSPSRVGVVYPFRRTSPLLFFGRSFRCHRFGAIPSLAVAG